jgi:hypothetical protein
MEWMWEAFHMGASTTKPRDYLQPHCNPGSQLSPQLCANKNGGRGMTVDQSAHSPVYEWSKTHGAFEWMWEAFNVGLGPLPINLDIMLQPLCDPGNRPTMIIIHQLGWWKWHDGGSICQSTACKLSQIHCKCLGWMWKAFRVGLGPQPMHLDTLLVSSLWPRKSATYSNLWRMKVLCNRHDGGSICH